MKKLDKKVNNVLYALVFELVLIPILGYISYFMYSKLTVFSFMDSNLFLNILLLLVLVILNIIAIYYIAYAMVHIFKFNIEYQIVTCLIILFIAIWFKLYYSIQLSNCSIDSNITCIDAMSNNLTFTTILIFLVSYNLLYIPMHIINKRKGKRVKFKFDNLLNK